MSDDSQTYRVPRLTWSLAEFELASGLSRATLYNMVRDGRLHTVKVGKRRLIPEAEAQRVLGSLCEMKGAQIPEATAATTRLPLESPWHLLIDKPAPVPEPRDWEAVGQALETPICTDAEVH